jgi:hypothetical protein
MINSIDELGMANRLAYVTTAYELVQAALKSNRDLDISRRELRKSLRQLAKVHRVDAGVSRRVIRNALVHLREAV